MHAVWYVNLFFDHAPKLLQIGSAYEADLPGLPASWKAAHNAFAEANILKRYFPEVFCQMLLDCKAQEIRRFASDISAFEYKSYLDQV